MGVLETVYYSRVMTQDDVNEAEAFWPTPWAICEDGTDRVVALCPTLADTEKIISLLMVYGYTVKQGAEAEAALDELRKNTEG